jgi:hypothetical protein
MSLPPNHRPDGYPWWAYALAAVALVAGGILLGRATAETEPPPAADPPVDSSDVERPATPGPTATEFGMPVGFSADVEGAVAAATAYTVVLGGPLLFEEGLDQALAVAATDDARADLEAQFTQGADLLIERLNLDDAEVVATTAPAGYRIDRFAEGEEASIAVWAAGFMIAGGTPIPAGWTTTTVDLVWTDGDWKLAGLRSNDGPEPPHGAEPGAVVHVIEQIEGFEPYRHLPAEVD